jgi:hypothetical protein
MLWPTVQSVSPSWNKAPIWGLRPDLYYCQTIAGQGQGYTATDGRSISKSWCRAPSGAHDPLTVTVLFLWGALSDKRMGLSFVYASGPRQRSLSRARVPWVSRLYFTVSVLRLPFSSPPTTSRVTVEVFEPASTQAFWESRYIAVARTPQKIPFLL